LLQPGAASRGTGWTSRSSRAQPSVAIAAFLAIGIIEGEKQGVHLTQDLFITNSAFPHVIFKGPRCSCVFILELVYPRFRSAPPRSQHRSPTTSCVLGWGTEPQRNVRWRFGRRNTPRTSPRERPNETSWINLRRQLLETEPETDEASGRRWRARPCAVRGAPRRTSLEHSPEPLGRELPAVAVRRDGTVTVGARYNG
jgi:hypothetical protein